MPKKIIAAVKKVMPKKVVTKKVAAKKSPVKKTTKEKVQVDIKKTLVYADDTRSFWLRDGQILNSLIALESALHAMDKDVFVHHVQDDKNDFADWVDTVLNDAVCAIDLRKTKTPKAAQTVVKKYLKVYDI